MVAEQGLYILLHTNVYSHVSHIQASALVPGGKDRQSQELAEEFINIRERNKLSRKATTNSISSSLWWIRWFYTGVRKGSDGTPASPDGVPGNLAGDNVGISLTRFP